MNNHLSLERKLLTFVLILLFIAPVFADHTSNITINPDIANCNELGNTFTVTVKNDANSLDSIWTVDIYKSAGLSNFSCGNAPHGWHLDTPIPSLCRYTAMNSSYYIDNGEQLNFTFDAVMSSDTICTCNRTFHVATLDNQTPTAQYQHDYPSVEVDCNAPNITKVVGTPKLPGVGFDWWITQNTQINITGYDSEDACDLGMDYCRWRYRVDNNTWSNWVNHSAGYNGTVSNISFTISFSEDSVHDIQIECYDIAGNKATLNETDRVDSTPPETNKTYGTPFYSDGTYDWITSSTLIDLTATDGGNICAVGVDKLYYRVTKLNISDKDCIAACNFNGDDFNGGPYGWQSVNGTHVQFTIDEESCHLIEFYTVDKLGNTKEVDRQCVFVDNTPPNGTKTIGQPSMVCGNQSDCNYWVTQNTPITLTCTDQEPHPVDNEKVCYKIYVDGNDNTTNYCTHFGGTPTQEGYCCFSKQTTLNFLEDSNHTLKYYCEDALGNKNNVDIEHFKVDSQAPTITKTVSGKYYGNCNPIIDDNQCWLKDWTNGTGATITVNSQDLENNGCSIDKVECQWWYYRDGQGPYYVGTGTPTPISGKSDWLPPSFDIKFYDETQHELHINCTDELGNWHEDVETFYVDSSGPNVIKEFIGPWYRNQSGVEWIDTVTKINLTAHDNPQEPCAVDNSTIYWKDNYFPNQNDWNYCYQTCAGWTPHTPSNPLNPTGEGWNEYREPFNDLNESCHVLEYYAVDALGNVGPIGVNCFFSDHTKPVANLTVGSPSIECENQSDCDYWVRDHVTPIYLNCENSGPHPSPLDKIQWRIWDDVTGNWTEWNKSQAGGNITLIFNEDSVHKIQYKCNDTVGKESDVKEKVFRVDSTPPNITKTMLGSEGKDWEGSCPPKNPGDICYVKGDSGILVNVYDPDPTGKGCAVDHVNCSYEVWWNNTLIDTGTFTNSTEIKFNEDSAHNVTIYCEDALGNSIEDNETFLVDKKPPVTIKTYGEPKLSNGTHLWITSSTLINLTATDNKIGVDYIEYRVSYIGNETCPEVCDYNGTGNWTKVNGDFAQFTVNEASCHLIEFRAVDKFGNDETIHKQCVMVDNTPPEPNKTVGKPKEIWDGKDAKYYDIADKCWSSGNDSIECWKVTLFTPITLDCIDPEPHPVDHEETCFKVEVDGDDKTEYYCNLNLTGGTYNKYGDGFCCGMNAPYPFYFNEETEHNLEYYCVDALGNKGPIDEEKFKVEGTSFNITINKKWNLISVPFVMLDNSIDDVFKDIAEDIISVWTYDGETGDWYVWTPGDGPDDDNLTEMKPGWGYWVLAKNDTQLVIGGSLFSPGKTPPGKKVVPGWNLIGYYGTNNLSAYNGPVGNGDYVYCALYSLVDTTIGNPRWSSVVTYWEPDNPHPWAYLNNKDNMDPGAGYWLEVDVEDTYTFSSSCGLLDIY